MDTTVVGPPERRNEQLKGRTSTVSQMFGTDLAGRSLPARGLFWSITVHVFGAVISLYVPWSYWFPPDVHLITEQSVIQDHEISYLPDLQPIGSRIPAPPLKQTKEEEASASSDSAKAVHGVVYQGPQLIVSNPPHPDNFVQTIRQPDLPVRPKLPAPLQTAADGFRRSSQAHTRASRASANPGSSSSESACPACGCCADSASASNAKGRGPEATASRKFGRSHAA